ncbi:MAG TPA: tetratricopeptide repeat protein [Sphingomonas sp.]|jgi:tetratricopeptide (TPR) repeat protein|uniref:tetratricopeptide repeat protein n=1 Tax=Sphingomonas sp. TaxID=28214 RepID=UPI002EDA5217
MALKHFSTTAMGIALAMGGAAVMVQPANAAKKEAAPAGPKLSKEVRDPLAAAQTAIQAGDATTGAAKVAEANAAAKTDEEKYFVAAVMLDLSKIDKNPATQAAAIDALIASNRAPADQLPTLYLASGQTAYQAKNYAKAEQMLSKAIELKTNNSDAYALLVEAQARQNKTPQALQTLQTAIDKQRAAGTKVPSDWYGRGINMAYTAKMPQQTAALTQAWVKDYPTPSNWRDSLVTYRELNPMDADGQLDLMRLQRVAGALKGQGDYMEYVLATYLRYPGEAKAVLDEGTRAGVINLAKGGNAAELSGIVSGKVAADKASLGAAATAAKGPKGTGKTAVSTGDAYLGYGDWANAAEMYKLALTKGGVDAGLVNTRLGMALAKAGQKDAAKQAFAQVTTGPRAGLAQYWMIWMDQQA